LAEREAYTLAYRPLSASVHSTSRAFDGSEFVKSEDGRVHLDEDPSILPARRALNASLFASTLCILSEPLGLDVFDEADHLKDIVMQIQSVT
jgi:hypothetical protein